MVIEKYKEGKYEPYWNRIITVPEGVTVEVADNIVTVKGPKGTLTQAMLKDITLKQEENKITLERKMKVQKLCTEQWMHLFKIW